MKKGHKKGDIKRMVRCNFCGGEHRRRSKELRECRARRGKGAAAKPKVDTPRLKQSGDPATRYLTDPLRGDKRAHSIAKSLRRGESPRRIAKQLNISLDEVKAVKARLEMG